MKKIRFPTILFVLILIAVCFRVILSASPALGQEKDRIREALFLELEAAIEKCIKEEVPLFAPGSFPKAMKLYSQANEYYSKGERVTKIKEKIELAQKNLKKASNSAKITKLALEEACNARKEASRREYIELAPKAFSNAERSFQEAILIAESGDIKNALKKADEAIRFYREMTILALKKGLLKETEKKLSLLKKSLSKSEYNDKINQLRELQDLVKYSRDKKFEIKQFIADVEYKAKQLIAVSAPPLLPAGFDIPRISEFSLIPEFNFMIGTATLTFRWRVEPGTGGSPIRRITIRDTGGSGPGMNLISNDTTGQYTIDNCLGALLVCERTTYTLTATDDRGKTNTKTVDLRSIREQLSYERIYSQPTEFSEGSPFTITFQLNNRSGVNISGVTVKIRKNDDTAPGMMRAMPSFEDASPPYRELHNQVINPGVNEYLFTDTLSVLNDVSYSEGYARVYYDIGIWYQNYLLVSPDLILMARVSQTLPGRTYRIEQRFIREE